VGPPFWRRAGFLPVFFYSNLASGLPRGKKASSKAGLPPEWRPHASANSVPFLRWAVLSLTLSTFACGLLSAQSVTSDSQDLHERWDSYLQTYGWKRITAVAAETAFNQTFQLKQCGRPPYCLPHQIGGALVRRTARTTIELGAGALLHEDLRRRPSGLPGFRRRFVYAFLHAPLATGPDGKWRPAYSRFAGTFGGVAVSSAWNGRPISAPRLFGGLGWSATSYFQDALLTEFEPDMKRMARQFTDRLRRKHKTAAPALATQYLPEM
jgi:hypothetical protein